MLADVKKKEYCTSRSGRTLWDHIDRLGRPNLSRISQGFAATGAGCIYLNPTSTILDNEAWLYKKRYLVLFAEVRTETQVVK